MNGLESVSKMIDSTNIVTSYVFKLQDNFNQINPEINNLVNKLLSNKINATIRQEDKLLFVDRISQEIVDFISQQKGVIGVKEVFEKTKDIF